MPLGMVSLFWQSSLISQHISLHVEDFSLRLHTLVEAVRHEFAKTGNNHWGTVTDTKMLATALDLGFLILPVTKQGNPQRPEGWVYSMDMHRGDFSHWMVLYCLNNVHFQLGLLRCGSTAPYQCVFKADELPAQLRHHYDLSNLGAPFGHAAIPGFI